MTGLVGVDEAHHRLFFTGNKDGVLEQQVYSVDYLKPGEPQRLTEIRLLEQRRDGQGRHAPAGHPLVARPAAAGLSRRRFRQAHRLGRGEQARRLPSLCALSWPPIAQIKFGTLKAADGSTLYWEMITPPLKPGKKYPVFFEHYGGPGTASR